MSELKTTPLTALHESLGAKMVPFAGYSMPVQYPTGVMAEHTHTRTRAGLFDVSHMGQISVPLSAAEALETLIPADILGLKPGRQRYGLFTNEDGGIRDDLMIARREDEILLVVNAACKEADLAHLQTHIPQARMITNRALLALQGPASEAVLASLDAKATQMRFMDVATLSLNGAEAWVSRSGYTGEDGFEISVPAEAAEALAQTLFAHEDVAPIGLGARDSLRLEAGLCLYGQDIDTTTTPIEANLTWALSKSRRPGGTRAGGFPGAGKILDQIANGAPRKRIGLRPEGRAPMRSGVPLFAAKTSTEQIGQITSGTFGPTLGAPVAMGLVASDHTETGTTLYGELRGKRLPLTVSPLPFTPATFKR